MDARAGRHSHGDEEMETESFGVTHKRENAFTRLTTHPHGESKGAANGHTRGLSGQSEIKTGMIENCNIRHKT